MAKTENAPDAVAAASEAVEALSENQTTPKTSETDDITEMQNAQGLIASHLKCGEENSTSTKTLMAMLKIPERELRERVMRERRNGAMILASQGKHSGYFLPADGEKGMREMLRSYELARSKAVGHLASVAPIYRKLKACGALTPQETGQISIDEIEKAEETQEDG